MAQVKIRIKPDGEIDAETLGLKGEDCLPYIAMLEELLQAETVDSSVTDEYYETTEVADEQRLTTEE